jgi:signal transduction histidine kinase
MALTVTERRDNPRIHIDGPMQYREVESHDFQPGAIEDISASGALIWICEELPLDSELIIRLDSDGPDETWEDLVATLLYKMPEEEGEDSLHGYGCSIELA